MITVFSSLDELKQKVEEHNSLFGGYVYIFGTTNNIKIGCSSHLITRLTIHDNNNMIYCGKRISRIAISPAVKYYTDLESDMHKHFNRKRKFPGMEVFSTSFGEAVFQLEKMLKAKDYSVCTNRNTEVQNWHVAAKKRHMKRKSKNQHKHGENFMLRNTLDQLAKRGEA